MSDGLKAAWAFLDVHLFMVNSFPKRQYDFNLLVAQTQVEIQSTELAAAGIKLYLATSIEQLFCPDNTQHCGPGSTVILVAQSKLAVDNEFRQLLMRIKNMDTVLPINLITTNSKICGGRPCIIGTGIRVTDIVMAHIFHDRLPGEIAY